MLTALQKQTFDEPACDHNVNKKEAGCPKPIPGKVGGGCSFDGAYSSMLPITDAAHIVHGPMGCLGNSWNNRGSGSSGPQLYRQAFITNFLNNDVVFGGEKKLYKAVKEVIERHAPPAVFVYQTCVTAMIGDDLQALCKAVQEKTGTPVIPVEAPGFIGTKNFGNRLTGEALLARVIGTREPATEHPFNINLIGEFNIAGEFWQVLPLFEEVGIRIICTLSGDARYHEVAMMHKADINMMVCSKAMLNVARKMKDQYDIPWFEGSFYGIENTISVFRELAKHFDNAELTAKIEAMIARETAKIKPEMDEIKTRLTGKKALLYTGGVKSWSMVSMIQETGMEVVGTSVKKSTDEDKARIAELLPEDAELMTQGGATTLMDLYKKRGASLLLAGGRNQFTAVKAKIPFVHVNQEREQAYAGFIGALEIARRCDKAVHSPAFKWAQSEFGDSFEDPMETNEGILSSETSEKKAVEEVS